MMVKMTVLMAVTRLIVVPSKICLIITRVYRNVLRCEGDDWFRCSNGHCISTLWLCDKEDDCMDWSDEANCQVEENDDVVKPISTTSTCPGSDFRLDTLLVIYFCNLYCRRCADGLCIPVSWTCDKQDDCHAGEDENPKLCGKAEECKEFTCITSGACIPHR